MIHLLPHLILVLLGAFSIHYAWTHQDNPPPCCPVLLLVGAAVLIIGLIDMLPLL